MTDKDLHKFIYFITHNKNMSKTQILKRDSLLARDLTFDNKETEILSKNASTQNTDNNSHNAKNRHRTGIGSEVKYTSPKNMQLFLREFNQDDVLKYTCHLIDTDEVIKNICKECSTDQYEYTKHVQLIKHHFEMLEQKFKKRSIYLNSNMYALISTYLTGSTGEKDKRKKKNWSSNDIEVNWNSMEIHEWATEHPHIIPTPGKNIAKKQKSNGYILPSAFKSNITGTRIKSFSDLVIFFKNQFHIRKDNSLRAILEKVNSNPEWKLEDVKISFLDRQFNDNVELFTDIDKFVQAYKSIVKICIENRSREKEPIQIELSFFDDAESESTFFYIHHLNSVYKKTSKNSTERIGTSHSDLISNKVNGLCDLFIEAKFGDDVCGKLNLWDENKDFRFQSLQDNITGVKYILRF